MSTGSGRQPIHRAAGVTPTERYLQRLGRDTFLSLWCHAGIHRDQGQTATSRQGKEVCDLLVVFQDQIIIFSDKDCTFPNTGELTTDWCRWFRRAIVNSAKQVWGAERWIRQFPGRLFLDRACTKPFPFDLPDLTSAKFHRVTVAHGASRRCKERFGASGSLVLSSMVVSDMHYADPKNVTPFVLGDVDPAQGFIHVVDDSSLSTLMGELDTVNDFVAYLTKRERLIRGGQLAFAAGEEDLLARYLTERDSGGTPDFGVKPDSRLRLEEGLWRALVTSDAYAERVEMLERSYTWDRLIETFNHHILNGTAAVPAEVPFSVQERGVRLMAGECRVKRCFLSDALLEFMHSAPPNDGATRVVITDSPDQPYYVFMVTPHEVTESRPEYLKRRRGLLEAYCMVTKLKHPDAQFIVGISTDPAASEGRSEDVMCFDTRNWTEKEKSTARRLQQEFGFLTKTRLRQVQLKKTATIQRTQFHTSRNSACPCGSGRKFKRCHGQ